MRSIKKTVDSSSQCRILIAKRLENLIRRVFKSSNVQCPYVPIGNRTFESVLKSPIFRDMFMNLTEIGTPGKYGIIMKACVSKYFLTKKKADLNRCADICDIISSKMCRNNVESSPLEVALKIQQLRPQERDVVEDYMRKRKKKIDPWKHVFFSSSPMWREIRAMQLMVLLMKYGVCPNVPLVYHTFVCDLCDEKKFLSLRSPHPKPTVARDDRSFGRRSTRPVNNDEKCVVIVNELSTADLKIWMRKHHSVDEYVSAMFQIFMGLLGTQLNFGMVHYDFHWGNVLYSNVNYETWEYRIYDLFGDYVDSYYVPTNGYLFKLWDFGMVDSSVGLGREIKIHSRQATTNNIYLNDCVHILYAYFDWSLKKKNKTIAPPMNVRKWAKESVKYIDDVDERNFKDSPEVMEKVIQHIFNPKFLKEFSIRTNFTRKVSVTQKWKVKRSRKIQNIVFGTK